MTRVVDFTEMFGEDPTNMDKLHPDLQPYLRTGGAGLLMVHHPLVVEVLPFWKMCNEKYERKQRQLAEALRRADWHTVIYLHERPYRLDALRTFWLEKAFDLAQFRELLPDVWSDSEPDDADRRYLTMWRQAAKPGICYSDVSLRLTQPEAIYRGGGKPDEKLGIAWTTDYNTARFFALRYRDIGCIWTATCDLADVLGYITDRNESEVIIDPLRVKIVNTETILGREPTSSSSRVIEIVKALNEAKP